MNPIRFGTIAALFLAAHLPGAAVRQPNFILIMADDLGYECVTANGGESYQTPHLDRLAATGMRFEHCHVQPVCTPTRVQLMTGLYNIRNYANFGILDPKATTFAHLLKQAGYATGICGKWQLGRTKGLPKHFGFDDALLWQHTRRVSRYANPGLERNDVELDYNQGEYAPKLINDFALEFVTKNRDRPFFLYYPMILTHEPYQATPDSADWNGKQKSGDRYFADMVAYMDKMVGRLVAKLDELGLRENTLVIFLADNGTGISLTSQFKGKTYPGGKTSQTARGTHVPLIANWKGTVAAGSVNANLISSTDFLPTLCELAGAPVNPPVDGQSFAAQLRGERGQPREWLYSWYKLRSNPGPDWEYAMTATHKLYRDGRFFDLSADPYEEKTPLARDTLSGTAAAAAKSLQAALEQFTNARPAHLMRSDRPAPDRPAAGVKKTGKR